MIVVIGIDPGIAQTGYGVIEADERGYRHLDHGMIRTEPDLATGRRLVRIHDAVTEVAQTYRPAIAGIESLYFSKNISSAFPVAYARGVVLMAFEQLEIPVNEYPPQEIKQAITGHGRAEKGQVQELVRFLLGLPERPKSDHAADALAAAICCYNATYAAARLAESATS